MTTKGKTNAWVSLWIYHTIYEWIKWYGFQINILENIICKKFWKYTTRWLFWCISKLFYWQVSMSNLFRINFKTRFSQNSSICSQDLKAIVMNTTYKNYILNTKLWKKYLAHCCNFLIIRQDIYITKKTY